MPQMNKDGKFILGKSLIREDLTVHLPLQALTEYNAIAEDKVYLFTGSKSTGGFCITRKEMMKFLDLKIGIELPSIRSSDIAFTMGAKGPLIEKAQTFDGEIKLY